MKKAKKKCLGIVLYANGTSAKIWKVSTRRKIKFGYAQKRLARIK